VNEIPMEKNVLPSSASNNLNEDVPPRKPLIAEVPFVKKQRISEGVSPLKGSLPRKVRFNDTNTNLVMKEVSTTRRRKVNLLEEIRQFVAEDKMDSLVPLPDIMCKTSSQKVKSAKVTVKATREQGINSRRKKF